MMNLLRKLPILLLASACNMGATQPILPEGTGPRVLFIGNSLTYVNDLPAMVAALSRAAGDSNVVVVAAVAEPDYSLGDHLIDGDATRAIAAGDWDVVVLQQGPSSLPSSRVQLIRDTRLFAERIRAVGARPALYMVWPALERFGDFDRASESYKLAADSVDGILFPAGEAWRAAWRRDASLPLYGSDQFHPSALGTYLAALVIYARLTNRPALGLPTEIRLSNGTFQVSTESGRLLQQAADEALANWGASAARR